MPTNPNHLRSIKLFPDLVRYLEEELDCPRQEYAFDELPYVMRLVRQAPDKQLGHGGNGGSA